MSNKAISLERFQDGMNKLVDNLKSIDITATLISTDWVASTVNEATIYTQTKSVTIPSKYENVVVSMAGNATAEQIAAAADAGISSVTYSSGTLTIVASKVKPMIDLPIVIQLSTVGGIVEVPNYTNIENVPIATSSTVGKVKPDNSTIQIDGNGTLSAGSSSAGDANKYLKGDGTWAAISNMTGADASTAGVSGLVPAPAAGDQDKFLKGDGSWGTAGGSGGDVYEDEVETTFSADGKTITEVFSNGTKTTVFNNNGTITETYPDGKSYLTTFNNDGSISKEEIV